MTHEGRHYLLQIEYSEDRWDRLVQVDQVMGEGMSGRKAGREGYHDRQHSWGNNVDRIEELAIDGR